MMRKLWVRLTAAFLLIAWISIGMMALVVRGATETSFRRYMNTQNADLSADLASRLEAYFQQRGTWDGADEILGGRGQMGGSRRSSLIVADPDGVIRAASDPALVGGAITGEERALAIPLNSAGSPAGWLSRRTPGMVMMGASEEAFLNQVGQALLLAWFVLSAAALGIAILLARYLARPISALTNGARDLAAGQLGRQVPVQGSEETVELARAFNDLSSRLAEGEALRRRMAADIAHELRTPLAVLRSQLEAMRDGVLPADEVRLATTTDQTLMLGRLVDDLRLLTLAEAGQLPLEREMLALAPLLREVTDGFQPFALDAGVTLTCDASATLPPVSGDPVRLRQVLGNLLANALRHTLEGGHITVRGERDGAGVRVTVENTGVTLTAEQAARAFDPFWRANPGRESDGGSGLGLAIARGWIAQHGGRIWMEPQAGGVAVRFTLPSA